VTYNYSTPDRNGLPRTRKHLIWLKWALEKIEESGKKESYSFDDIPSFPEFGRSLPWGKLTSGWKQDIINNSLRKKEEADYLQGTFFRLFLGMLNQDNEEQLFSLFEEQNRNFNLPEGPNAIAEMRRLYDEFFIQEETIESIGEDTALGLVNRTIYTDSEPEKYTRADLLKRRKNIVLEGPPGTGKTFAMKAIIKSLENDHNENIGEGRGQEKWAITMHPATAYEDFIEGLRPSAETTVEASIDVIEDEPDSETNQSEKKQNCSNKFEYQPGVFVKRVKDAIQKPNEKHVVLLDELNRCNVPRVLGDLLTTVEADKRTKPVIPKANSDDPWYGKEVKIILGAVTKPPTGSPTGFRFYQGTYVGASRDKKANFIDYGEDGNPQFFENVVIPERSAEFLTDGIKVKFDQGNFVYGITFLVYQDICYPVFLTPYQCSELMNNRVLENCELTILTKRGKVRCDFHNMAIIKKGGGYCRAKFTSIEYSESKCKCQEELESDHYWCNFCDDKWDSKNRTEVILSGSEKKLHIPNNLYIVATMNTTDRSVAPLDAALRRRFVFIRVDPLHKDSLPDELENSVKEDDKEIFQQVLDLWQTLNDQLKNYLGDDATIGHSYLFELVEQMNEDNDVESGRLAQQFWQYSVLPQVADLLDATGNATSKWKKMNLDTQFEEIFGVKIKTPSEQLQSRAFSRTIVSKS
jgi:MoxR-like ATPase